LVSNPRTLHRIGATCVRRTRPGGGLQLAKVPPDGSRRHPEAAATTATSPGPSLASQGQQPVVPLLRTHPNYLPLMAVRASEARTAPPRFIPPQRSRRTGPFPATARPDLPVAPAVQSQATRRKVGRRVPARVPGRRRIRLRIGRFGGGWMSQFQARPRQPHRSHPQTGTSQEALRPGVGRSWDGR